MGGDDDVFVSGHCSSPVNAVDLRYFIRIARACLRSKLQDVKCVSTEEPVAADAQTFVFDQFIAKIWISDLRGEQIKAGERAVL